MINDVNPFLIELLGYSREQFLGKTIWELGFFKDIVANIDNFEELQIKEYIRYEDMPLETADGRLINVEFVSNVYLVNNKKVIQCNIRDITKRKRAEETLKLNSDIFNNLPEGIYLLGADDGMIKFTNPRFEEMFGYSPDELIGKPVSIVNAPTEIAPEETTKNIVKVLTETGKWHGEIENIKKDGSHFWCYASVSVFDHIDFGKVFVSVHSDITERKQVEHREQLVRDILEILNTHHSDVNLISNILLLVKRYTDMEAVAIRLKKGADFPYYVTHGFPEDFVLAERTLCSYDEAGNVIRDEQGTQMLDCMCGNVLCGRASPSLPFFTEGGSFWTNGTTELLASTSEADRQSRTRNRCNGEGYESVALIPLRSGDDIVGLLQLNDRRSNMFTLELIHFFEGLGASIGIALSHKFAEEELRKRENLLTTVTENFPGPLSRVDRDLRYLFANSKYTEWFGRSPQSILGLTIPEVIGEKTFKVTEPYVRRALAGERVSFENPTTVPSGKVFYGLVTYVPDVNPDGNIKGFFTAATDITDVKRAEEALDKKTWLLSESQRIAHIGTWELNIETDKIYWSEEMYNIYGISPDVFKHDTQDFFKLLHPDDLHSMEEWFSACYAGKKPSDLVFRAILPNGNIRWIKGNGEMHFNNENKPANFYGTSQDITDIKQAEEALRHSQEQLRQSQKMEAIGRLAGGIAHDFNNMLTVINNYSEFVIAGLRAGDPLRSDMEQILKAGQQSADLTRQLLAFSRKQALAPEILDLNIIVSGIEPMLRRLIGEDIDFIAHPKDGLGRIKADPGQMEQVIMNLAVNSRDAMPKGGKLIIETANVELDEEYAANHPEVTSGQYVMMSITDTGCGMNAQIIEHIFEPFYTTKEVGKGTGLGLSTVYGIVKQSGGHIWIYSEPGRGTTFKIYLPLEFSEFEPITTRAMKKDKPATGTETILVVEDEPGVLSLVKRVLEASGYTIHTAANGGEALLVCERYKGSIDLLITDVVMPNMGGPELTARLSKICPNLKVLYMSGYTEDAIVHSGILDQDINFITKPFSLPKLKDKVREILNMC